MAAPTAKKETAQKIIIITCIDRVYAASLFFPRSIIASSGLSVPRVALAGDVLVALGFLTIFFVLKENTFSSGTIELAPNQRVISTGPYAVRAPPDVHRSPS